MVDELERMRVVVLQYVTEELAEKFAIAPKAELSLHTQFMSNEIVLRIVQEVYGRQLEKVEASYPRDWWQAFKDRWFPGWAKQRWPVRRKHIELIARELYPKMALPEREPVLSLSRCDRVEYKGGRYNEAQ